VAKSVPFVRFRVERVLAAGDHSSPEGRDRMVDELRPLIAARAPSPLSPPYRANARGTCRSV
jgi:hypothetical protein